MKVLIKQTFPRLRAWCESRRLSLVEVDLRWGVPKESTAEVSLCLFFARIWLVQRIQTVFRTCLGELDRCYDDNGFPFFVNLLSHRYGWVPSMAEVPAAVASEYDWVPNVSITHMEILHGLITIADKFMMHQIN